MMGNEINFRPATFYLGIADMLAREAETQMDEDDGIPEHTRVNSSPSTPQTPETLPANSTSSGQMTSEPADMLPHERQGKDNSRQGSAHNQEPRKGLEERLANAVKAGSVAGSDHLKNH
jgi:hypothetical protein